MDKYFDAYEEALEANEENTRKWEKYKEELKQTENNLKEFVKSTKVDIMVPMGKKALVKGQLIHTNEITVCHGSSVFSDCSQSQALEIIQHRLQKCEERLKALKVERDLFSNKLSIPKEGNVFARDDSEYMDIVEESTAEKEEEYKKLNRNLWKIRKQKGLSDVHTGPKESAEITDEELFAKLEEMELMEELNEELEKIEETPDDTHLKLMRGEISDPHSRSWISHADLEKNKENPRKTQAENPEAPLMTQLAQETYKNEDFIDLLKNYRSKLENIVKTVKDKEETFDVFLDLNELKEEISDDIECLEDENNENFEEEKVEEKEPEAHEKPEATVTGKPIPQSSQNGDDISSEGENSDDSDDNTRELISELQQVQIKPKRKVSFSSSLEDIKIIESNGMPVEHSDNNTIHIHFQHSDHVFNPTIYEDEDESVQHPADIYKKFRNYFNSSTTKKSILKNKDQTIFVKDPPKEIFEPVKKVFQTFAIGDVVEHKDNQDEENIIKIGAKNSGVKKVSKFKQMRQKS